MDPNAPLPPPQGPMGTASGLPPQPYLPPPQGQAGQAVPQNSAYPYADYRASYVDPRAHLPQRTASVSQHHQPGMYGPQAGAPRPMYAPQYYPAPASGGSPSLIPAGAPPAQRAYSVPHPYSQAPQQAPYYPGYNAPYGRVPYQHSPLHPRPYPVQARPPQGYPGGAAPPHPAGPASNRYSVMPPPHGQPIYPQQPDGDQIPQQQQQHDPNVQPPQPLQSQQQISSPSPLDGRSSPALQMQSPRPPAFAPNRYSMMPPSQQSVYPRQGAWMPEHGPPPYPMVKRDSVVSNASSNLSSRSQPVPPQTPQSASDYGSIPPAGTPASEVTQGELLHHTPSIRSDRSGRRQEHHEGTSYDENAAGPGQLRVMLQEELNKAIAEISRLSLLNDDLVAQKSQAESARRTSEAERDSAKSEVKQLTELLEIARAEAGDALGLRARVTELEGEVDRIKLEHGMALSVNEENKSALQTMENMRHRMADLEVQLSQAQMAAMQLKDRELSAGSEAQSRLAELEEQVNNLRRELAGSQTEAARLLKLKGRYESHASEAEKVYQSMVGIVEAERQRIAFLEARLDEVTGGAFGMDDGSIPMDHPHPVAPESNAQPAGPPSPTPDPQWEHAQAAYAAVSPADGLDHPPEYATYDRRGSQPTPMAPTAGNRGQRPYMPYMPPPVHSELSSPLTEHPPYGRHQGIPDPALANTPTDGQS